MFPEAGCVRVVVAAERAAVGERHLCPSAGQDAGCCGAGWGGGGMRERSTLDQPSGVTR